MQIAYSRRLREKIIEHLMETRDIGFSSVYPKDEESIKIKITFRNKELKGIPEDIKRNLKDHIVNAIYKMYSMIVP